MRKIRVHPTVHHKISVVGQTIQYTDEVKRYTVRIAKPRPVQYKAVGSLNPSVIVKLELKSRGVKVNWYTENSLIYPCFSDHESRGLAIITRLMPIISLLKVMTANINTH